MATTETAALRRPSPLWPHLTYAAFLSLLFPTLGSAYLGLSPHAKNRWQARAASLTFVFAAVIFLMNGAMSPMSLLALVLLTAVWLIIGAGTAVREIRMALKAPEAIVIPEKGGWLAGYWIALITLMVFMKLANAPDLIFFQAKNDPGIAHTKDGLLYGLGYEASDFHIQRGQLLLVDVEGGTRLVRVIALPGDILIRGNGWIQVNDSGIYLPRHDDLSDHSWVTEWLSDIAASLAYPDNRSSRITISGKSVAFDEAAETIDPVRRRTFIAAYDDDLIAPKEKLLPTMVLSTDDVVMIPWGKFWSLDDSPGAESALAQPAIIFSH